MISTDRLCKLSMGYYNHSNYRAVTCVRGGLIHVVFDKTLRLPASEAERNAAVTLMSTDVEQIITRLKLFHEVWATMLESAVGIYLLELQVSWACIAPVVTVVCK